MNTTKRIICGIYQIKNLVNEKVYIGYSCNILHRWRQHKSYLRKGTHHSKHLQRAWDIYYERNFEFTVLEECSAENLAKREHYWTILLDSCNYEKGYNTQLTSESGNSVVSEETKEKLRQHNLGRNHSEETKLKMSLAQKGKYVPPEVGRKISASKKGIPNSKEHNEKVRQANLGKKASDESRAKMSAFQKGREKANRIRKKVIDTATGVIYNSAYIASQELNMNKSNLYQKLKGNKNNNTTLKYLED